MPRRNKYDNHRGANNGRGRGRGGPDHAPQDAVPNFAPRHRYAHANAEIDVVIQRWPEYSAPGPSAHGGGGANRGNGPWRGGPGTPKSRSGAGTPRARGGLGGRGRGRGRGQAPADRDDRGNVFNAPRRPHFGVGNKTNTNTNPNTKVMIGKNAPLSDLLYAERPLLRPVKFVRATMTPFLFQHSEDVLKSTADVADATKTSHVPTAARVARLFHQTGSNPGPDTASDSDSDSDHHARDALEEIDFADLAQVRAEVDAIAEAAAMKTASRDTHEDEEEMEVVDFADLAAIRAKVDAAEPTDSSQDEIVEETFTGAYNRTIDATQVPSNTDVVEDDEPSGMQPTLMHNNEIPDSTSHESFTQAQDRIVVEEESSNELPNMPAEQSTLSIDPTPATLTVPADEIPLHSDAPSRPLYVVDTTPTHPLASNGTSEVILVDRAGHGETLGDQDEERIVYVAPHPRSRYVSESPVSAVPPAETPQTSMMAGRAVDAEAVMGGLRSPVREDDHGMVVFDCEEEDEEEPPLSLASLTLEPTVTPPRTNRARKAPKRETGLQRRQQRQNKRSRSGFGEFGAMMSETRLRKEDTEERRRPQWATRRKGDSDLDWGTDSEDEDENEIQEGEEEADEMDVVSDGLEGMEIDSDLEMDVDAMQGFLKSMSVKGSHFVTMDDVADEVRTQQEDEGLGGPDGSSESGLSNDEDTEEDAEEDEMFNAKEHLLIAESDSEEELSEDTDKDDELSPRSGFQARLRKLRERSRRRYQRAAQGISDEEDEEEGIAMTFSPGTRSAKDEKFIARIQDFVDENSQILSGHDRKQKKAVFRNLHHGYVDVDDYLDDPEYTTPVNKKKENKNKNKGKGKEKQQPWHADAELAAQMEAQWTKDRAKKAARKREREQARLSAALDPLSVDKSKSKSQNRNRNKDKDFGGSKKAMRKAARLDAEAALAVAPRMVVDVVSLEAQLRRFAEDPFFENGSGDADASGEHGGKPPRRSIALPPMGNEMRKMVHELAAAFGIKSVSKGKGAARYTTLIRTARTGVGVNEQKVRSLTKRYSGRYGGRGGKGGDGGKGMPRHREGEVVGKEAPKIGEGNVGFKMLASMGWSEGDRIGSTASVGIEAPLTAIIKRSKLGLGATR